MVKLFPLPACEAEMNRSPDPFAIVKVVVFVCAVESVWLNSIKLGLSAAAAGVGVYSVAPCYMSPPRRAGLLFGYASLTEREIDDGIVALAGVLRGFV